MDDLPSVVAAQRGELDLVVCSNSACGQAIRVARVVALRSYEQNTCLLFPTDDRLAELAQICERAMAGESIDTRVATSTSAVAAWLSAWRSGHLQRFNEHQAFRMRVMLTDDLAVGTEDWTPEFFAALYAMTVAPPIGSHLGVGAWGFDGETTMPDAVQALELMSAQLDEMVWLSWIHAVSASRPLTESLVSRVVPASVRAAALDVVLARLGVVVLDDGAEREIRYTAAAIAAYVGWQAGIPIEFEQEWSALWLNRERLLAKEGRLDDLGRVDPEMVAATTSPESFRRYLGVIARKDLGELVFLSFCLDAVGRSYLLHNLLFEVLGAFGRPTGPDDGVQILEHFAAGQEFEVRLTLARALVDHADTTDWAGTAWALADALLRDCVPSELPNLQLRVEAWVGEVLKDHGLPDAFLARVGESPRDWEDAADLEHRFALAAERSNALRLKSRFETAIEELNRMRRLVEASPESRLKQDQIFLICRNIAIIRRDAHDHEGSLVELLALLPGVAEHKRTDLYSSLAVSYVSLGRSELAREAAESALEWSSSGSQRGTALALVAQCRSMSGDTTGAREALRSIQREHLANITTLLRVCVTLLNLDMRESSIGPSWEGSIWGLLDEVLDDEGSSGDTYVRELLLLVRTTRRELQGAMSAHEGWLELDRLSRNIYGVPSPEALIGLALEAWRREDMGLLRRHLDQVSAALVGRFKEAANVSLTATTTSVLQNLLDLLVDSVLERGASTELGRVLAELSRDLLGRTATGKPVEFALPWDDVLSTSHGGWTIVEWLESGQEILCLVTTLRTGAHPETVAIHMPPLFDTLGAELLPRLRYWKPNDPNEPFAIPAWDGAEMWVRWLASEFRIERLVIVEHERYVEVPWQVLFGPHCPVTCVPSVSLLLASSSKIEFGRIGAVAVSRYGDQPAVSAELDNAASAIAELASASRTHVLRGAEADRVACLDLLSQADMAVFLCHGVFDAGSRSMAWLVADNGVLPPAGRFGGGPGAQGHRITAVECDQLASTARVVLSAACSSGVAQYAGVGEQIGLFGALRRHGTTSLIAPRWDVPAGEILPILVDIADRILGGEDPVLATQLACRSAADRLPRWIAWALFHQGTAMEDA
ncbi:CHAT domain-containing protein [Agromyces sp. CF514]|nr:CHAT domain-containing protein [Agromyces sp. CF514]